ncbi:pilus assembly protein [Sandarakinorhabdus sp.]|uniref:TadE/TadG family type IV pilus assembly protein n=1 Tax=Sandarakinorhabdus sp. TaxID=1916663 RepID=UPI00286DC142|nr:pilus assembly protein [Sandarakinorhabdus sp.]
MIRTLRIFARNRSGATAAEFALTLPLFLAFVFTFFGVGSVFWANAGLRNAVGEGARVATLFPRRSNTEIQNAVSGNSFGLASVMAAPTITAGTANAQDFVDITVTVTPHFDLFFIDVEPITLSETRRVYRPA